MPDPAALTTPRFALIAELAGAGRWDDARSAVEETRDETRWAHDGYRDAYTRCISVVLAERGQAEAERLGQAMLNENLKLTPPGGRTDFRGDVLHAVAAEHWHQSKIRVLEDDKRVTLLLEPCGSGGRLVAEGAYWGTGERPQGVMPQASTATFMHPDLPDHCAHCAEVTGFNLGHGSASWMVEGWATTHRHNTCKVHVYKRIADVPDEFFERTGATRPAELIREQEELPARVFSDAELAELARSPLDAVADAVRARDAERVGALIAQCADDWHGMHGSLRAITTSWWDMLLEYHGEEAQASGLRQSAWELFRTVLRDTVATGPEQTLRAWAVYWRALEAVHTLELRDGVWSFTLDPTRLVYEKLARRWPGAWLEGFCVEVNRGMAEQGLAQRFGSLAMEGETLVHRVGALA